MAEERPPHAVAGAKVRTVLGCLIEVASRGGADRLLLGGDTARKSSFVSYDGMPGLVYLPGRFVSRLKEAEGEDLTRKILVENPARLLTFVSAQG